MVRVGTASPTPDTYADRQGGGGMNDPHTPNSVGGGLSVFNDNMTVDSWGTAMTTTMLQPHKTTKGVFQCAVHLSFTTKDPLEPCPYCERQQRLSLQERRQSVEQQLKDIGGTSSSGGGGANTSGAAKDILSDLQSTVDQWKQQPDPGTTAQPPTSSNGNHHHHHGPSMETTPQPNMSHHTAAAATTNGVHHQQQQQHQQHQPAPGNSTPVPGATPAAVTPNMRVGTGIQSPPPLSTSTSMPPSPANMMPPNMATMMQPPMVPSFSQQQPGGGLNGGGPTNPSGSSPLEALAFQIQGMQRMQDWMLLQKEQECQQLRQRLDAASQQINSLAVENALLQEKLNQQEQRMKHELKLIKMAAMQQRNKNQNSNNNTNSLTQSTDVVVAGSRGGGGASVSSQHSSGSGGIAQQQRQQQALPDHNNFLFPSDTLASATVQPKTSVERSALSHQDSANLFHHNNGNSVSGSVSTQPTSGGTTVNDPSPSVHSHEAASVGSKPAGENSLTLSPGSSHHQQQAAEVASRTSSGPVDLDDITDMIKKAKTGEEITPSSTVDPPQAAAAAAAATRESSGGESFSYANVPRDISIDPSASTSSNAGSVASKSIPTLPPPKEKASVKGLNGGSSAKRQTHWPDQGPAANSDKNSVPAPVLVNFPDSDNMSLGNTVASSTYGEDRQQVVQQSILDPYGDKGTYTGVILRSTGMPHGSGRMIYQEDKRTYDGEWRHGRWHGYGRATFANGDNYHGEYRFDQRHGRGRYEWNDGRIYDGMFREDKRHGRGVFTWPDGAVYDGDFRNGQREGHGTYKFSDGGRYEGSWKDGRYNGYGVCNWEDGRCYKGEWLNGMAHGKGVETFADGTVRHDGQWIEDEPVA
mmetsp:Transcript_11017/g.24656  ORF Transcript_11017/g.24656 Transcript_11017/m.24656 type:complete len:866 (+) Transcript_11017:274-2871(+)